MSSAAEARDGIDFNVTSPEFIDSPYAAYRHLREHTPVLWVERMQSWIVARYDDVVRVLRDDSNFSSSRREIRQYIIGAPPERFEPMLQTLESWMLSMAPPAHTQLRKLFNKGFLPNIVRDIEPCIQAQVDEILDAAARQGGIDAAADFAYRIPAYVIADMFRLPKSDYLRALTWSDSIGLALATVPLPAAYAQACQDTFIEMKEYFREIVADVRKHPGRDFMSFLVNAEEEGERLPEETLLTQLGFLLFAGHETTRGLITNAIHTLLAHPEQMAKLKGEPQLITSTIEEVMRFDGPVQFTFRLAVHDVQIGGVTIKKGQVAIPLIGSANRDPSKFAAPDKFDITRGDVKHLTFGVGTHYCLGAGLARLEAKVALQTLFRRFPDLRIDESQPQQRIPTLGFRGFSSLPIRF